MPEDNQIIQLSNVVLRYETLFEAKARSDDKPDDLLFGATVLMDNNKHATLLDKIDALTERVALDEFKKKIHLKNRPVKDGNEKADKEGFGDGVSYLSAYRKSRPGVVDRTLTPLTKEDGILYPGCTVNMSVRLYAYDHKTGGKGVTCELIAVQFVRDGERFSGGTSTDPTLYFKPLDGEAAPTSSRNHRSTRSRSASMALEDDALN